MPIPKTLEEFLALPVHEFFNGVVADFVKPRYPNKRVYMIENRYEQWRLVKIGKTYKRAKMPNIQAMETAAIKKRLPPTEMPSAQTSQGRAFV